MNIVYIGKSTDDGSAYGIINHNFIFSLLKMGHNIFRNWHNQGMEVPDIAIANQYPPQPLNYWHEFNVCLTNWEFATPEGYPRRKVEAINQYHLLCVPCEWTKEQIGPALDIPIGVIRYGVDSNLYHPYNSTYEFEGVPQDAIKVLWVGGTDKRHGFDIALEVLDRLPDNYYLIAKQSTHYPEHEAEHPRLKILREEFKNLAFLYNACDLFLQSGRGVGFCLPALEALACGLPVVSTPLPPLKEFQHCQIHFSSGGQWERTQHNLFDDCSPSWFEPDVEDLLGTVLKSPLEKQKPTKEFVDFYSWESATQRLLDVITEAKG